MDNIYFLSYQLQIVEQNVLVFSGAVRKGLGHLGQYAFWGVPRGSSAYAQASILE
jgi:hypothetical protein